MLVAWLHKPRRKAIHMCADAQGAVSCLELAGEAVQKVIRNAVKSIHVGQYY
jgi:hypothetical protein